MPIRKSFMNALCVVLVRLLDHLPLGMVLVLFTLSQQYYLLRNYGMAGKWLGVDSI